MVEINTNHVSKQPECIIQVIGTEDTTVYRIKHDSLYIKLGNLRMRIMDCYLNKACIAVLYKKSWEQEIILFLDLCYKISFSAYSEKEKKESTVTDIEYSFLYIPEIKRTVDLTVPEINLENLY